MNHIQRAVHIEYMGPDEFGDKYIAAKLSTQSMLQTQPSPPKVSSSFVCVKNPSHKIYPQQNFFVYNTESLTIGTLLYSMSLGFIHIV